MNPGVLSLRCPACGRPFLSLPQQQMAAFVTCPHCAQSARLADFSPAGAPSSAAALPLKRRVIHRQMAMPAPPPVYAPPVQMPPQAYPQHPYQPAYPQAPVTAGSPAPWPPAPEQPPMFAPTPTAHYPQAPISEHVWSSGIPQATPPEPVSSPFSLAETPESPFSVASAPLESSPMFRLAPEPGYGRAPIELPASAPVIEYEQEEWRPPSQRRPLLPAIIILAGIVGACLWVLRDDLFPPMVMEIPAQGSTSSQPTPAPRLPDTTPASAATAAAPAPGPLEPEVRRAELPPTPEADLVAAGLAAEGIITGLLTAKTPEERASFIDRPDEQSTDLEEFFQTQKPAFRALRPSKVTPLTLPGKQAAPLFQVATSTDQAGALMRLVPQVDGSYKIDWPLFAETHDKKLAQFITSKSDAPSWMHLSFRRSHAFELPEDQRSLYLAFIVQGSADGVGSTLVVVPKTIPLGRYLDRETEWTTVYLGRFMLQHRKLENGSPAIFILDCEGAATSSL